MYESKGTRGKQHKESKTKLFERWASMHARCKITWPHKEFYFDKDIRVCDEWKDFLTFKTWAVENGFDQSLELDRRDNDKGYSPDNCRWITHIENNLNRSNTTYVYYNGERLPLAKVCSDLALSKADYRNVRDRVSRGWNIHDAITKPRIKKGKQHE